MSETKVCQCCLEEVLATNYLLHSLYCERNIIQCEICDERIDMNEKNAHMESHQKTECSYCQQMFEYRLIEMHKNNCPNKPEKCGFCELMINLGEMARHQAKCGSRTEQCQICKKHIQKREFNLHLSICGEAEKDQKECSKRNRLKRITSESSSDASVKEIKQITKRKPQKQIKQQSKQKEQQILTEYNDDDDQDFQKALQMTIREHRHLSHPIHQTPKPQLWRSLSIPRFFSFSSVKPFPKLLERIRRKSCHCNQCGNQTTFEYRNMSVPFIKNISCFKKQSSMNNNRLLTTHNTKKLFRKHSASRNDTLTCTSSSQLLILTNLRRASARSTEKLIEDTQIRIFDPPKSCRSHLLSNLQSEEIKTITLQIPKSQRIIKTQMLENQNIKLFQTRSTPKIYTRNFLNNYLTKYKKKKTISHLLKN